MVPLARKKLKSTKYFLRGRHFSLLIFNCGFDVEDPTPPSPPVWVQKSLPEEWPERGIDAHESGGIYLEWEQNPEADVFAYNVYRATWYDVIDSLGEYDLIKRLETDKVRWSEYIDREINLRIKYVYKLKAENVAGNLSQYSDSLHYSLLPNIRYELMVPNGLTDPLPNVGLCWGYTTTIEMEDYCITVLNAENEVIVRSIVAPGNYTGGLEFWDIPDDLIFNDGETYKWRIDTGAKYIDNRETAGSESPWATFLYVGE